MCIWLRIWASEQINCVYISRTEWIVQLLRFKHIPTGTLVSNIKCLIFLFSVGVILGLVSSFVMINIPWNGHHNLQHTVLCKPVPLSTRVFVNGNSNGVRFLPLCHPLNNWRGTTDLKINHGVYTRIYFRVALKLFWWKPWVLFR